MMDPVRERLARCAGCQYYVCVCGATARRGVNHVEAVSAARPLRLTDLRFGRVLQAGDGFVEREAWRAGGTASLPDGQPEGVVVKSVRATGRRGAQAAREREVLLRAARGDEAHWVQRIVKFFEDGDALHLVLEPLPGGPLQELVRLHGVLDTEAVKYFAGQVACGLRYLHQQGVVHRDLRTDNLLLDAVGRVRLAGLSHARLLGPRERALTLVGTPPFMAPEVLEPHEEGYGHCVDWWALGAVVHEMAQGVPPLDAMGVGEQVAALRAAGAAGTRLELTKARRCVDRRVWDLVRRLLDAHPGRRAAFAAELREHELFRFYQQERMDWTALATREAPVRPPPEGLYPPVSAGGSWEET